MGVEAVLDGRRLSGVLVLGHTAVWRIGLLEKVVQLVGFGLCFAHYGTLVPRGMSGDGAGGVAAEVDILLVAISYTSWSAMTDMWLETVELEDVISVVMVGWLKAAEPQVSTVSRWYCVEKLVLNEASA